MGLMIDQIGIDDLDALVAFATPFQAEALSRNPALLQPDDNALRQSFQSRIEHGAGVVARQDGNIVGCLLGFGPIENFRPGRNGMYGPVTSCLTAGEQQDLVFTRLLTSLGELPKFAGTQIAAFTVFPHLQDLNASLSLNGFGVRCADSVARIDDLPTTAETDLVIEQVAIADAVSLREVKQSLGFHLASSPVFQEEFQFTPEFIAWASEDRQSVHFAARDGDRIVGFIEATFEGENYLTVHSQMRNICGAGVLPEYRNRGIMRALLVALTNHYRAEGITVLGVDYETQNPNARGFWESLFTPYTWSWERVFDRGWGPV